MLRKSGIKKVNLLMMKRNTNKRLNFPITRIVELLRKKKNLCRFFDTTNKILIETNNQTTNLFQWTNN